MHAGGASGPDDEKRLSVNHFTVKSRCRWQGRTRARSIRRGGPMQMHQIRYFLALSAERNFTRAAKRCGVSQPSLTNAIIALERALGGALFQRKPLIALTALGRAVPPLSRPDRPKRQPCARGRAGAGRRAEVNVYAIAAGSS